MSTRLSEEQDVPEEFVREQLKNVEKESRMIRELLHNLANITEPIVKEYMPGMNVAPLMDTTGEAAA